MLGKPGTGRCEARIAGPPTWLNSTSTFIRDFADHFEVWTLYNNVQNWNISIDEPVHNWK